MAISREFIQAFSTMVKNYTESSPLIMKGWRKDAHFESISSTVQALLDIIRIEENQSLISDRALINSLSNSAVLLQSSDPSFLSCYKSFLLDCKAKRIIPDSTIDKSIDIDPNSEEEPPIELINSLHSTLETVRRAGEKQKNTLEKQLSTLRIENEKLRKEIVALKNQIHDQVIVEAQVHRLEKARSLILALNAVAGISVIPSEIPSDITAPAPVASSQTTAIACIRANSSSLANYPEPVQAVSDESLIMPDYPPPPPPDGILSESLLIIGKEEAAPVKSSPIAPPPIAPSSSKPSLAHSRELLFSELKKAQEKWAERVSASTSTNTDKDREKKNPLPLN
jgi:hypothetical protein